MFGKISDFRHAELEFRGNIKHTGNMPPIRIGRSWRAVSPVSRWLVAMLAAFALLIAVQVAPPPASAATQVVAPAEVSTKPEVKMADLSKFNPGDIISDAVFFARGTMTEAQIQSFLNQKVPSCRSGYTCLKDWKDNSRTIAADQMCSAYSGAKSEPAARIIYKVASACRINPQVLLVMLQKEQGLVTHEWPSDWRYRIAMGQGCPDTAACDTRYYGFFNQLYGAAWQLKRYANPPGTSKFFTWYAPGNTWDILYNPNHGCGRAPVRVANQATANLYYYTPYQPNRAALAAGYGLGDGCSAYGNRNFFNYFTDWFGSTHLLDFSSAPTPGITGAAVAGQQLAVSTGSWSPGPTLSYQWMRNGSAIHGETGTRYAATNTDSGKEISVKVTASRSGYQTTSKTSASVTVAGFNVERLSGPDRYATAVAVSKRTYPNGANTVYLVNGENFPDAVTAAPRAATENAALLLTARNALPASVATELNRLKPKTVVFVGGLGVIDNQMSTRVRAALGNAGASVTVTRIGGSDRYETSRLISASLPGKTVYLVTGSSFPDALGAGAAAGKVGAPVLLVKGARTSLDSATLELIRKRGTTKVVIVGGAGVVSSGISAQLSKRGISVARYGGPDRYATNALLNKAAFGGSVSRTVLATGVNFPDALSGSVLSVASSGPLFVSQTSCLSPSVADYLVNRKGAAVSLIGGPSVLSGQVEALRRC